MQKFNKLKDSVKGKIPEDWSILSIEEISEVVNGGTPSTKDSENFGGKIPWITPKDLSDYLYRYIEKGERNITQKGLQSSSAKLIPKGSVLLTTRAPVGYVAIAANEVTTNQGFKSLIPKENVLSEFLYYLLKSNTKYLKANSSGTTFGELNTKVLKSLKFLIPPLEEQYKISNFLSKIDEKIELNHQMNNTLEKITQAIFKSWFIDFEPYQDGEFVESELGKIPKGWSVGKIEDLCKDIKNGGTPLRKQNLYWENGYINWFKTGELEDSILLDSEEKITEMGLDKSSCHLLPVNTVVIAIYAAPTVGRLGILKKPAATNQACTALIPKSDIGYGYIFHSLLSNRTVLNSIASGSAQQNISQAIIRNLKILNSPREVTLKFQKILDSFYDCITKNKKESETIVRIKNLLQPQLISGRLRIRNPQKFLEEISN